MYIAASFHSMPDCMCILTKELHIVHTKQASACVQNLCVCSALQVYMLDKRLLDPRRPTGKPSQDDQLEQLIPYQQDLPLVPLQYATHSRQVAQLSGELISVNCHTLNLCD